MITNNKQINNTAITIIQIIMNINVVVVVVVICSLFLLLCNGVYINPTAQLDCFVTS